MILLVALLTVGGADASFIETTLECHVRQYKQNISRPHTLENGTKLQCHGMVIVDSCWGRCDSNEVKQSLFISIVESLAFLSFFGSPHVVVCRLSSSLYLQNSVFL